MASEKKVREGSLRPSLSLAYRGRTYPVRVKRIGRVGGSPTYSVEIRLGGSDTVVIDAADLLEGLIQAERILPVAFAARRLPSP